MPPAVVWTHRAERRLQDHLIRADGTAGRLTGVVAEANDRLAGAFPHATAVVVLELYAGFRPRPQETILRVDVRDPARPGPCIVKLAPDDRLRQELDAWLGSQPLGFRGNAVFMGLEAHYRPDYPHRLAALVYQDAQQHIGADETLPLEEVVLRAVRLGSPDPHSVLDALGELFTHLGRVLYTAARVADPEPGPVTLNPDRTRGGRRRLADILRRWNDSADAVEVRQQVGMAFPPGFPRYLDPVDYFRYLEDELAAGTPPDRVLPRVLRGRAHGDLHGRNVLVGVEQNRAASPALFDYEHMSCDNLLGWDFVKLETELKVRALAALHPSGRPAAFAARAEEFETALAEQTHRCRDEGAWPDRPCGINPGGESHACLEAIVLAIRRAAAEHLGTRPNRPHDWLHEYYFLLGCYGLYTVGYENQTPRERAAALVSAGVAAALYEQGRPGGGPAGGGP